MFDIYKDKDLRPGNQDKSVSSRSSKNPCHKYKIIIIVVHQ